MIPTIEIQTITREVIAGRQASGHYLQMLVRAVQGALGDEKGRALALDAVGAVHEQFYAVVLDTIGADTPAIERNRRATFARSAASTLRAFVKRGGQMALLDAATVSKQGLREARAPRVTGSRTARGFQRAAQRMQRLALRLVKDDPKRAAKALRAAMAPLQAQLSKLEGNGSAPRRVGRPRKLDRAPTSLVVARGIRGGLRARAH